MSKILTRERPYKPEESFPWDAEIIKRFGFDNVDIDLLEKGEVLFIEEIAYSLLDE